jgi:hypothetical protein
MPQFADFLEEYIARALDDAGITYTTHQRLDFYLPAYGVYIEVKQYHSPRADAQLASQEDIILLQGKKSVDLFIKLLNKAI